MKSRWLLSILLAGCAVHPQSGGAVEEAAVRNLLIFIADGAGIEYWTAAKAAGGTLAVEQMPVAGLVVTKSATSDITDSAASATAYATGVRSYNRAISVGVECQELLLRDSVALRADPGRCTGLESVFDVARRQGMATGVVTTAAVTDATPAAFVAKSPWRYWQDEIAEQFAAADLEVLLGGGRQFFESHTRADGRALLTEMCIRAVCVGSADDLGRYRVDERPLVGLFAAESMDRAGERTPSFPRMVEAALLRLGRADGGFVAVLEVEGTDDAGHANEPLASIAAEMLEFDRGVAVGLEFARANPGTLVIVTSDHETGGLGLINQGGELAARYHSTGHTGTMVPLFASGPQAQRFAGIRDNDEIGRLLLEIAGGAR